MKNRRRNKLCAPKISGLHPPNCPNGPWKRKNSFSVLWEGVNAKRQKFWRSGPRKTHILTPQNSRINEFTAPKIGGLRPLIALPQKVNDPMFGTVFGGGGGGADKRKFCQSGPLRTTFFGALVLMMMRNNCINKFSTPKIGGLHTRIAILDSEGGLTIPEHGSEKTHFRYLGGGGGRMNRNSVGLDLEKWIF